MKDMPVPVIAANCSLPDNSKEIYMFYKYFLYLGSKGAYIFYIENKINICFHQ
ncbi:hypothetical protein AB205_0134060 [Aquarana catesbeiana]|uniref:Uncharacterized protein n=1 Tax=Aquarana catesbeiana TaxID=8400 RepID=A0A2G9QE46_AQUCT|nr:hypothetical protein AB205_0134060 [Aquarana catesbeiana]